VGSNVWGFVYGRERFVTTVRIPTTSEFIIWDHVIPSSDLIMIPFVISSFSSTVTVPVAINIVPFHVIENRFASVYVEGFIGFDHTIPSVDVDIISLLESLSIHCPTATQIYPFHATSLAID